MTLAFLRTTTLLTLALLAPPAVALGDDRPPCSDEADAVRAMQKRDPSLAYPTNSSAKQHLEAGKRAFGVQQYDKAVEEYTAAGLEDGAPLILYNLGQTYRAAKDYEKAIRQYQLFLERGKPGKEVRALVECHITTMAAELEHAASTAPPTEPESEQTINTGGAPVPEPSVSTDAAPDEDDDDAIPVGPPSRWTGKRKVAVGLGVGGLGGLAAGVVFSIQNKSYKDDAARLCPSSPCDRADEANALSERASTKATLANISFGVGAGLVVGAVVLWFVGAPSTDHSDGGALIPQVGRDYSGLAYTGRF
jgi:tetratricopeptide (TPR) repeat protein